MYPCMLICRYNGHRKEDFVLERFATMVDQQDNHLPTMSVHETLDFGFTCQTGQGYDSIDSDVPLEEVGMHFIAVYGPSYCQFAIV